MVAVTVFGFVTVKLTEFMYFPPAVIPEITGFSDGAFVSIKSFGSLSVSVRGFVSLLL